MSMGTIRIPLHAAEGAARELAKELREGCVRIEVAGSIRRRAGDVGDIEFVAVPIIEAPPDLFAAAGLPAGAASGADGRSLLWAACDALMADGTFGKPIRKGDRYAQYPFCELGINVDIFAVVSPATWGAILAIRTGGAEFSQHLVESARRLGRRCIRGAVYDNGSWQKVGAKGEAEPKPGAAPMVTETEEQFFQACGVRWIPPEDRK